MSRPFRTDPDRLDGNEITINEFSGLNEVSPYSLLGQPSVLENVGFDSNGGYTPIKSNRLLFTNFYSACAWDNKDTIFKAHLGSFKTFDVKTGNTAIRHTPSPAIGAPFVWNLAPQVAQSKGIFNPLATPEPSYVFTSDGFSQPWDFNFTGLAPIPPVTPTTGEDWLDPAAPDTRHAPATPAPLVTYTYEEGTRVGWSMVQMGVAMDYDNVTFAEFGSNRIAIFYRDKRIPDGGLIDIKSLPPQKLVFEEGGIALSVVNSNSKFAEYAIVVDHSPDLEIVAFGAAYPATRRLYKSGTGNIGFPPFPFLANFNTLPQTGTAYTAGQVYTFGLITFDTTQRYVKRLTLLCLTGGTPTARSAAQIEAFKKDWFKFGAILIDTGGVTWQVVNDLANSGLFGFSGFEQSIDGITFPPVGWLRKLPDSPSPVAFESQWGRLDTVADQPYRTYIYRNLHVDQIAFPVTSPRYVEPLFNEYHKFRNWCVPAQIVNFPYDVPISPRPVIENWNGTDQLVVLYSEIEKPWDFRGRFIIPNFRRSSKTTSLKGLGNILIIHGDADACALYGDSEANFQSQHLDIEGCPDSRSACVIRDRYYWYSGNEIFALDGGKATPLSKGRVDLPKQVPCAVTIDADLGIIFFVFTGAAAGKTYLYHIDYDAWSTKSPQDRQAFNISKHPLLLNVGTGSLFILDAPPIDTMNIRFQGLDAGNAGARKRWSSIHFRAERINPLGVPPPQFTVQLSVDATANTTKTYLVQSTDTATKSMFTRLRNHQGRIAELIITVTPEQQRILLRPPIRLEVTKQGDGRYEH